MRQQLRGYKFFSGAQGHGNANALAETRVADDSRVGASSPAEKWTWWVGRCDGRALPSCEERADEEEWELEWEWVCSRG